MYEGLLDPKMDFIFKNIFGSEQNPDILISFLNAVMKPADSITSVEIKNTDIEREYKNDELSRLDIKASTNNNEIINIEVQVKNEYDMIKRSVYYWSKLYGGQLAKGDQYDNLERTVCINILNFKCLNNDRFHNCYRLKEIDTNEELTDVQEIHFVEIPKLNDNCDQKDMLVAWTEFLKNPESEKVRNLEMTVKEIREAKDKLIEISNDEKTREIYKMREKAIMDYNSAMGTAKKKGREEGVKITKVNLAKNLLDILDDKTIAEKVGLTLEEIEAIRNNK